MKILIDEKVCLKHNLTMPQALLSLSIKLSENFRNDLENLEDREVIGYDPDDDNYMITHHWSDILDEIICDSSGAIDDEKRLTELAKKMRECYPEGKMPGTAYYYRCNNREVVLKLKKFFLQYGNYTDDKIIDATKRFVASFQGAYRYLPLIKYFISKNKTITDEDGDKHIQEVSELASYLENKDTENSNNENWMLNSKN